LPVSLGDEMLFLHDLFVREGEIWFLDEPFIIRSGLTPSIPLLLDSSSVPATVQFLSSPSLVSIISVLRKKKKNAIVKRHFIKSSPYFCRCPHPF
jgi:hypothetical protein